MIKNMKKINLKLNSIISFGFLDCDASQFDPNFLN